MEDKSTGQVTGNAMDLTPGDAILKNGYVVIFTLSIFCQFKKKEKSRGQETAIFFHKGLESIYTLGAKRSLL